MTTPTKPYAVPNEPVPSEQEVTNIALEVMQLIDGLERVRAGCHLAIEAELMHLIARRAAYHGAGPSLLVFVGNAVALGEADRRQDDAMAQATSLAGSTIAGHA